MSRPWFQTDDPPTARLDGARLILTDASKPHFPLPPTTANPRPAGDCDPSQPGVQFIFGGDSHVYVPNGTLELCAGPKFRDEVNGQQIAVYSMPEAPRLVPVSVSGTGAGTTVSNPESSLRIAEGSGLAAANIHYHDTRFPPPATEEGAETLHFSGYTPPAGYSIAKVELRASYKNESSCLLFGLVGCLSPQFELVGFPSTCGALTPMPSGLGFQAQTVPVTGCMTTGNRIASPFDVRWHAQARCSIFSCPTVDDQLDGIEFEVMLAPDDPNRSLRPASGCVTDSPNYWYGAMSNDCALLKVDAPFWTGATLQRGRMSFKGTVYAPTAAIDVHDTDVSYPIFGRGLIARHFRLKAFSYAPGYSDPIIDTALSSEVADREVLFFVCKKASGICLPEDPTLVGRAAATFDAATNTPSVKRWSVAQR